MTAGACSWKDFSVGVAKRATGARLGSDIDPRPRALSRERGDRGKDDDDGEPGESDRLPPPAPATSDGAAGSSYSKGQKATSSVVVSRTEML